MSERERSNRKKVWTKAETLMFLTSYASRKDEFEHTRKKKFAYAHVLEDMIYQGFDATNVTAKSLEGRMRTLLTAYKAAKDNGRRTGAASCIIPYWDNMEDIFGNKPIISNEHSKNFGSFPTSATLLPAGVTDISSATLLPAAVTDILLPSPCISIRSLSPVTPTDISANTSSTIFTYEIQPTAEINNNSSPLSCTSSVATTTPEAPTTTVRHRKSWKENYYKQKLDLQKQHYKEREDLMQFLKSEISEIKNIEKEKLELLKTQHTTNSM